MKKLETAFILAGGKGSRLKPITYEIPKPLIPVKGKPVLAYNIENVMQFGVKKIVLGTGYMAEKVEEYFKKNPIENVEIIFSRESKSLGTAGALKLAEETGVFGKEFIMCNGDELKDINYEKVAQAMEKNKDIAGIALTAVQDVSQFGVVELIDSKIQRFIEKPDPNKITSHLINTGAYVLTREIFNLIPKEKETSIEKDVFARLAKEEKLTGVIACNAFYPLDTFERYEHALLNWNNSKT